MFVVAKMLISDPIDVVTCMVLKPNDWIQFTIGVLSIVVAAWNK